MKKNEESKSSLENQKDSVNVLANGIESVHESGNLNNKIEAIEKAFEEVAENKISESLEEEKVTIEKLNYDSLTLEEIVATLQDVISNNLVQKIKEQVASLRMVFNLKYDRLIIEKKATFVTMGGDLIDFKFSSPVKSTYNQLILDYKKARDAHYNKTEQDLKNNLNLKLSIIEDLKNLINSGESPTMYQDFKELDKAWKSIGFVSKDKSNDLWKNYRHHVERFYDLLHLRNDFRDLDLKNNLKEKLTLIKRAEELVDLDDAIYSFDELQELHRIWKEDIGPVGKKEREEIWIKFNEVSKKVYDNRNAFFKKKRENYAIIKAQKKEIIEKINGVITPNVNSRSEWGKAMKAFEDYRKQYLSLGKLPYAKNEELWNQFKKATVNFNNSKNIFFKEQKAISQQNLEKRLELLNKATSLKDSDDIEGTTAALKKLQADWKKLGYVSVGPAKKIWHQFRDACNYFFDRIKKQEEINTKDKEKVAVCKEDFLKALHLEKPNTKEDIIEIVSNWREIGKLSKEYRRIEDQFSKQIDQLIDSLTIDKKEASYFKFTIQIDDYSYRENLKKLDDEQLYLRKKIENSIKEAQQLENNLSFFSNATDDNPLVLNVKNNISQIKETIALSKKKLAYIRGINYTQTT